MRESTFEGSRGLNIFSRTWLPGSDPRAVIVIVPGFNSHGGYYESVAAELVADRLAVYAVDLRGRGRSDGERFFVNDFQEYVGDVAKQVEIAAAECPGVPIFLLGHSAGGVAACLYALDNQEKLAGLICESFAFEVPAPDFALAVLKGLSHIAPHAHVIRLKNKDFSRDPKVVERMNNDPLIANEVQPTQTIAAIVRADERLRKEFSLITLPLFILHGTADKAAKYQGSQFFFENAGSADKTLKLYEGAYHDPLNDVDGETVLADIRAWLDERISIELSASGTPTV